MKYVASRTIDGRVAAPPSKSMTVRALAAGLLAGEGTRIVGPSVCEDARAALEVVRALGARVEPTAEGLEFCAPGGRPARTLDCGESGLTLRLFAAVAGLFERESTLLARGSLCARPVDMVVGPLRQLGVACRDTAGRAPLTVAGPYTGCRAELDAGESSQFLTGLLMALPLRPRTDEVELEVRNLSSKPYVRMTLELLAGFGIELACDEKLSWFRLHGGQRLRPGVRWLVEGDWSGAAGLLVAGALAGRASVSGLAAASAQADRAVLDALALAGARVRQEADVICVQHGSPRAFSFDARACPDLLPPLAALACGCPGTSRLLGASRLRHKESDRAAALVSELGRMGASIRLEGDALLVTGGALREAEVYSHGDHRIAMACALAAVGTGAAVRIRQPGCVAKSYPGFFDDLARLGAEVG